MGGDQGRGLESGDFDDRRKKKLEGDLKFVQRVFYFSDLMNHLERGQRNDSDSQVI